MRRRIVLKALLAAGFIASCSTTPRTAPKPIAPPAATQSATTEKAALQRPAFIEFYSTL